MKIQIGDWVRFEKAGAIVLGIVQYIDEHPSSYPYKPEALTDVGRVEVDRILERRPIEAPHD